MKKLIAGILAGAMVLSFASCRNSSEPEDSLSYDTQDKNTTRPTEASSATSTTNPSVQPTWEKPVAPSGWEYPEIDLSEGKYTPTTLDPDALASKLGYKDGTYEYEYFRALSGISFYARIASNHVSNAVKNYTVSDLAEGFYKTVSRETLIVPYENILFHTFLFLQMDNFYSNILP